MAREINWGNKTYVMGILNANSDSFVPNSTCNSLERGLERVDLMIDEGADIIDIGGESTRPGSRYVDEREELSRVIPLIKETTRKNVLISVDTYKPEVARQALDNGALMINDITGGRIPDMLDLAREYGTKIVLMYNNVAIDELPHAKPNPKRSGSIVKEVLEGLEVIATRALSYGISRDDIVLDPGIGFQKSLEDNVEIIKNIHLIKKLGYAVLVGASNKGFIGRILREDNPDERLEGTLACTASSVVQGIDIVRVHNVRPNARVSKVMDYIYRS